MAVARELSIVYGGLTVSEAPHELTGTYRITQEPDTTSVEFEFLVSGTSEADFNTQVAAAETEFNTPWQDLTITLGGQTLLSLTQSGNEGFDAQPRLEKLGDAEDSGRLRKYRAIIEFGRPASYASTSGLRSSSVGIDYTPARRRTIRMSGVITAVSGSDARAQYDSVIDAYTSGVITSYGGGATYELTNENTDHDTNDKTLRFQREYEEIVFGQGASAGTDDTGVVRQSLQISRNETNPGFSPSAHPLVSLTVRYDAWVDNTVTTDLVQKWADLQSWVLEQVDTALGGSTTALVREDPLYDFDENRITVTMEVLGRSSDFGKDTLSKSITTEDRETIGEVFVPVWTGDPYGAYRYQGPAQLLRTITEVTRVAGIQGEPSLTLAATSMSGGGLAGSPARNGNNIAIGVLPPGTSTSLNLGNTGTGTGFSFPGSGSGGGNGNPGAGVPSAGGGSRNWVLIDQSEGVTPLVIGFGDRTLPATDIKRTSVYRHYNEPPEITG